VSGRLTSAVLAMRSGVGTAHSSDLKVAACSRRSAVELSANMPPYLQQERHDTRIVNLFKIHQDVRLGRDR
jgi:hypothetical protein